MGTGQMGNETMGSYGMKSAKRHAKGFTLIASLMMLLLLSGIAIGLMMMVNTEGKVGGTDLQNNVAYHTAEGGIEKMSSDLSTTFQNVQSPSAQTICNLGLPNTTGPALPGVTWTQYSVSPQGVTCPASASTPFTYNWGTITGSGQNAGLKAQIIPVNMLVTAAMPGGQEVSMMRNAQVALIPVFQFGVFCEGDCSFFPGSNLDFAGPVHTNGDLYPLAGTGAKVTFHDKVSAYGNIVRTQLPNGYDASTNYAGNVYIPTADGNCASPGTAVAGVCLLMPTPATSSPFGDGSVIGAGSAVYQSGSAYNSSNWTPFSQSSNYEISNGNYGAKAPNQGTGATKLSMPFVNGTTLTNELIRRAEPNTDPAALTASREENMAQIRILLSDDPTELSAGGAGDANNIRLANITQVTKNAYTAAGNPNWTVSKPWGIAIAAANWGPGFPAVAGKSYNLYFAAATNGLLSAVCNSGVGNCLPDWPASPKAFAGQSATQGLQPTSAPTIFNINSANYTAPSFTLCPTATLPPQNYPFLPANKPALCPANAVAPYYYLSGTWNGGAYSAAALAPTPNLPAYETQTWNLIDGYLRVDYKDTSGNWNPVTLEWLQLGFARGPSAPTQSGAGTPAGGTPNPINPNAILLLQEPADRATPTVGSFNNPTVSAMTSTMGAPQCTNTQRVSGTWYCTAWTSTTPQVVLDAAATPWEAGLTPVPPPADTSTAATQSLTQYNWYPINFYDVREGEVRDNTVADNSCSTNGVMNAVEIDVGNLQQWLLGNIGTNGKSVDYKQQNGYVLYFSDRRGMLVNPNLNYKSGDAGLEDVINRSNTVGTPDGTLDPVPAGRTWSPEDVNENGQLDNWGAANLGLGFWGTLGNAGQNLNTQIMSTGAAQPDPFGTDAAGDTNNRIGTCGTTGRENWVSGARHVLRLVDGSLGNVPLSATPIAVTNADGSTSNYWGGLTVASENPVYIWGDYNTNAADWAGGVDQVGTFASASVIADAVTLLSVDWNDYNGIMGNVTTLNNRNPSHDGYYRVAVAGGKNLTFQLPTFDVGNNNAKDFGTDGGVHNFLRYLETWSGQTVHYKGSLVSLFYSTYDTGIFKCCTTVYGVPTRNYVFDSDFSVPAGLPPGTPMFKGVNTLSYRQFFSPRTSSQ